MTEVGVGPFQLEKHTFLKWVYKKIRNLKHKYGAIKTQLLREIDKVQSSIKKRLISRKDIGSQT